MNTTTLAASSASASRPGRRRLVALLLTLLTATIAGTGTAAPAHAAVSTRAYVCFDAAPTAYGYSLTEGAWWYNGSQWVLQGTTTIPNDGGCKTWTLGRSGYWYFSVASSNKVTGFTEWRSGQSQVAKVNSGDYLNFGHATVSTVYGPYWS